MQRYHIVYPHTLDGHCAAAIVKHYATMRGERVECYPIIDGDETTKTASLYDRILARCTGKTRQQELPNLQMHDTTREAIYLLGVDVTTSDVEEMKQWGSVIYCNHHNSLLGYEVCDSCVLGTGLSTAERMWDYLFPHDPAPPAVTLIGRYTVTDMQQKEHCSGTVMYEEAIPFAYALRSMKTDPGNSNDEVWKEWEKHFSSVANSHTSKRIKEGTVIVRYLNFQATAGDEVNK